MIKEPIGYGMRIREIIFSRIFQVVWIVIVNDETVIRYLNGHIITNPNIFCSLYLAPFNFHLIE